jgi:hypothetical protein
VKFFHPTELEGETASVRCEFLVEFVSIDLGYCLQLRELLAKRVFELLGSSIDGSIQLSVCQHLDTFDFTPLGPLF